MLYDRARFTDMTKTHCIWETDALAPSTLKIYRGYYDRFSKDDARVGSVHDVLQYLQVMRASGQSVSALRQAAAALIFVAKRTEQDLAAQSQDVKDYISAAHRADVSQKRQVAPLTLAMITQAVADRQIQPMEARLLTVGLLTGMRRSELVAVKRGHVTVSAEGAPASIFIPRAKRGARTVLLNKTASKAVAAQLGGSEWLFPGRRGAEHVSTNTVARLCKAVAIHSGRDPGLYSGHSLRTGFVTGGFAAGMRIDQLMSQTGHRSPEQVMDYARRNGQDEIPEIK